VTLDESWFSLSTDHEPIWLTPKDESPQGDTKRESSPKMMLTVIWNPHGFHLIDVLPTGNTFHAVHPISHILSPLREIFAAYQDDPTRHFVIHADNAILHCAKKVTRFLDHNSLCRALHPRYSPDLDPSDLWLFGGLKGVLPGSSFDEPDDLLSAGQEILREGNHETLDAVFQECLIGLQNVSMEWRIC
jgi:hypothetical protein